MKLTPKDLLEMGVIDDIIPEPLGGAHHDPDGAAQVLKDTIFRELESLSSVPPEELVRRRIEKYAKMGFWKEKS